MIPLSQQLGGSRPLNGIQLGKIGVAKIAGLVVEIDLADGTQRLVDAVLQRLTAVVNAYGTPIVDRIAKEGPGHCCDDGERDHSDQKGRSHQAGARCSSAAGDVARIRRPDAGHAATMDPSSSNSPPNQIHETSGLMKT